MKLRPFLAAIAMALACSSQAATSAAPSSYIGQETREIKALSPEEVQGYLSGKGMGMAKAAELNGFPGPSHVLALASELGLTQEQRQLTQALFAQMEADASQWGRSLIDEERKLDTLFASKSITPELLSASLARLGELQAKVRAAHLEAHLAQSRILTPEQVARYIQLRGYASAQQEPSGHRHQH
jgi:Spy/CpxP family protein refolding chaperone